MPQLSNISLLKVPQNLCGGMAVSSRVLRGLHPAIAWVPRLSPGIGSVISGCGAEALIRRILFSRRHPTWSCLRKSSFCHVIRTSCSREERCTALLGRQPFYKQLQAPQSATHAVEGCFQTQTLQRTIIKRHAQVLVDFLTGIGNFFNLQAFHS